ncbi:STAS/SEC14 domain-containing protein [Marinomonas sp. TI.3.20]|uniref:STAS/SEC14 domain-containing protein n=1 Tax=Marinomonas sp. TI.3.20 TaxID=3121296 RepID=UPI00311EE5D1
MMLEIIEIGIDNALAFQMSGKITESDMNIVLSEAKDKIERHGQIVIYEKINSFEGVEIAAMMDEFKYIFDVGMSNILKVAILTDKKWIEQIVNFEGKIFSSIQMKCFTLEEQGQAVQYLKAT